VKNQNFEKANVLVAKLQPALESLGVTIENQEDGIIESTQQGNLKINYPYLTRKKALLEQIVLIVSIVQISFKVN